MANILIVSGKKETSGSISLTANRVLTLSDPEIIKLVPDADNYTLTLPPPSDSKKFKLINLTQFVIELYDNSNTFIAFIGGNNTSRSIIECRDIEDDWFIDLSSPVYTNNI